jgi:hypothetical protein
MLKPICVACKQFYRPHQNGYRFLEGKPMGDEWMPYKLWLGDVWKCKGCGNEIIVGTGNRPVSENWMPMFEDLCLDARDRIGGELLQINDC